MKKGVTFEWNTACQTAFDTLKELLTTAPVLSYPRFGPDAQFILETDASSLGFGAVLAQKQDGQVHTVAYASRTLNPQEKNYGITEMETLTVVWAAKHFRPYLLGHHCTVFTDHSACLALLNSPHPSAKLARWAMCIQELDLEIKYKPGKHNTNADALSRNPMADTAITCAIATKQTLAAELCRLNQSVMELHLEKDELPEEERAAKKLIIESKSYETIEEVLHHEHPTDPAKWCMVVPKEEQTKLLQEYHGGKFAGHFAERKMYSTLRQKYWWKGMRADGPFHRVVVDVLQLPLTEMETDMWSYFKII